MTPSTFGQAHTSTEEVRSWGVRTTATFRLSGPASMTAAAVTERLGVDPTSAHEDGQGVSARSPRLRKGSIWLLTSSEDIEHGVELEEQLERLLSVLEPRATILWALVAEGYEADWFCFVASDAAEHAVELPRALLSRLLQLPGDLLLDVCGESDA